MGVTRRGAFVVLLVLVLSATARALGNGFTLDDLPIVVENSLVHRLDPPWVYAQQSYWPSSFGGAGYRPWTVWWLAIQHALAFRVSGIEAAPWVFHLGNALLTLAVTLLVFGLLAELVSRGLALAGAAVFAVHPVHVEATASVVGQGELWMSLFVVLAVVMYVQARNRGRLGPATLGLISVLYVLAGASKEQGMVLPGILLGLELFRPPSVPPMSVRDLLRVFAVLAAVGIAFFIARWAVLGDLGGGVPAAGLGDLSMAERTLVMLPIVPHWIRLLVWPRDLAAHYSQPAFGGSVGWGVEALVGLLLLGAVAGLALVSRRRAPLVGWGVVWVVVALLPVSNIPFPTGILFAERTMMLPSAGVAIIAAGLLSLIPARAAAVGVLAVAVLVALGAARSWARQAVWRDNDILFAQSLLDGPRSHLNYVVYAYDLVARGYWSSEVPNPYYTRAKMLFAKSVELYDRDPRVYHRWGYILQAEGRCDLAVPILERGVALDPAGSLARKHLVECLLTLHHYERARRQAEEGLRHGHLEFDALVRATARSPALALPR